jgi:hypothetical protein
MITRAKSRLTVCGRCEYYSIFRVCKVCKCFMPLKVRVSGAECPEDKWGKL